YKIFIGIFRKILKLCLIYYILRQRLLYTKNFFYEKFKTTLEINFNLINNLKLHLEIEIK
ncbi:hypothetical protein BpHYR1_020295, partial [Brachionus plicatilis]